MAEMSDEERRSIEGAPARLRLYEALAESYTGAELQTLAAACQHYQDAIRSIEPLGGMVADRAVRLRALGQFSDAAAWDAARIQRGERPDEDEQIAYGKAVGILPADTDGDTRDG